MNKETIEKLGEIQTQLATAAIVASDASARYQDCKKVFISSGANLRAASEHYIALVEYEAPLNLASIQAAGVRVQELRTTYDTSKKNYESSEVKREQSAEEYEDIKRSYDSVLKAVDPGLHKRLDIG